MLGRLKLVISLLMLGMLVVASAFYAATPSKRSYQASASNSGAIKGIVLDDKGQPISGVRVMASLTMGLLPSARTDREGVFLIGGLRAGTYMLSVSKEEDGYPNSLSSFHFGSVTLPQVTVYEGKVTSDVTIRLGLKAATLTGQIVDARTKRPIENAQLILRRRDNPDYSYTTGPNQPNIKGGFKILVPSVPFTIQVSAPGYNDWHYRTNGLKGQTNILQLAPNTTKELKITLQPQQQ